MGSKPTAILLAFSVLVLVLWPGEVSAQEGGSVRFECPKPGSCFLTNELVAFEAILSEGTEASGGRLRIVDYDNTVLFERTGEHIFKASEPSGEGWQVKRESGRWRVTGQGIQQGYYIAQWLPPGAEQPSSYLRFVVIEPREYYGTSPFAVDAAFSWFVSDEEKLRQACQLLRAAGVDWVRDRFSWGHIQPERDAWDWSRYDRSLQVQRDSGMNLYQVFHDTAIWAARAPDGNSQPERFPPQDINDLERFLKTVVGRYKEWVRVWEVWNEMDNGAFFSGTAEEYVALLQKSYRAIKAVDPNATVLLGSVCMAEGDQVVEGAVYADREGSQFLERVLACGAGAFFDVYNFHHYGPVDGLPDRFGIDHEVLQRYGQATKPVWLSEIGLPSAQFTASQVLPSEREQAEYLVKAYALALSLGVEKVFFFMFPTFLEHGRLHWGICDDRPEQGWTPKPAYVALAQLTHLLRGGRSLGRVDMEGALRGVLFEGEQQRVLLLWSLKPEGARLQLPAQGKFVVKDLLGHRIEVGGHGALAVTVSPLLITGDVEQFLQGRQLIAPLCGHELPKPQPLGPYTVLLRCQPNVAAVGDRVRYDVQIYNETPFPRKGELVFETSHGEPTSRWVPGLFVVEGGGLFETSFETELSSGPTGEELQKVILLEEEKEVATAKAYLEIVNPIEIVSARLVPAGRPRKVHLEVTLENKSSRQRDVRLGLIPKSRIQTVPRTEKFYLEAVAPLRKETFQFALPPALKAGRRYALLSEETAYEYYLDAPFVSVTDRIPKIDGKPEGRSLSQWHLWKQEQCVSGRRLWDGPEDLSGEVAFAVAGDALYISGKVADDDRCPSTHRERPWTGDAVELFIDFRTKDLGQPSYGEGVYQLFLVVPSPIVPEGRLVFWQPSQKEISDALYAFRSHPGGYDFELLLPLKHFGLESLGPGRQFALDVVLDDRDFYEGGHKQMAWQGTINNWRDPSVLARVVVAP